MPMTIQELEDQKVREDRLKREAVREALEVERSAVAAGLQVLADGIRHGENKMPAADAIELFARTAVLGGVTRSWEF
jgi:hypothetical protein